MRRILAAAVAALPLLLPCRSPAGPGSPAGDKVHIKMGYIPGPEALPLVAIEEDRALSGFILETFDNEGELDAALTAGAIDGAVMDPLPAAILESKGIDLDIATLALGSSPREGRYSVLASPKSDIIGPRQLRGVAVAVGVRSTSAFVTDVLLREAGLEGKEIVLTDVVNPRARMDMLLNGQMKAATLPDPLALVAESRGARPVLDDTRGPRNLSQSVLVFTDRAQKTKVVDLGALFFAYGQEVARIAQDPETYRKILLRRGLVPREAAATYRLESYPSPRLPDRATLDQLLSWGWERRLLAKPLTYEDLTEWRAPGR